MLFFPKAMNDHVCFEMAGLLTCFLKNVFPSKLQTVTQGVLQAFIAYSSGNCPGLSPDSLLYSGLRSFAYHFTAKIGFILKKREKMVKSFKQILVYCLLFAVELFIRLIVPAVVEFLPFHLHFMLIFN
jgi:hypothetical protein